MIVQIGLRIARVTAVAAAILIPSAALAIEDTTRTLAKNQRAIEELSTLGVQLKSVLRPEIGFPEKYVVHWQAAVDAAFAPDLLEADFLKAFETQLSDETRDAALAFDSSPVGQEAYELIMASQGLEGDAKHLAEAQKYLDTASVEENALHVDFFESQGGPKRATTSWTSTSAP
ncbi:hypothetical protein ABFT80_26325 [Mesorhizobium sp. SB112]|uniref:hypothetical protein n=1 Tax=Mesorhizobium sp. SB112 TaxID=3151853 RepID=UPI0032679C82